MENATFAILTSIQAGLAYLRAETVTRFGRLERADRSSRSRHCGRIAGTRPGCS
ncbi:hypothetical protein ACU4GR_21415 [Methylobacterium oryzae CBMB20]